MNIEKLLPETDLQVYKVTNVLDETQVKLLVKLAEGKIPTGFKTAELERAVADIRQASIDACEQIFKMSNLQAAPENKRWPWFDLGAGEKREVGHSGIYLEEDGNPVSYFSEFMVRQSDGGGEVVFSNGVPVNLAPGEMLVGSRRVGHEFEIKEIASGIRWTLLTHIFVK